MNTETPITFKYQTGGSLSATDPTYVQRQADQDLYNLLQQGEFCYVLNSRQMGKSSLRVRTMQRLQQDGYACAEVDLSGIGSQLSEEKWYNGLVHRLMRSFTIPSEVNWRSWWKEHSYLSSVQRLGELFEEILLPSVPQNIVIFLDEIDSVLSFDFPTDDFFALIRYYYNQRVNNPNYNRLRFCLLGVATPSELIQDKQRTPFNIGRGVELTGLTEAEAIPVLSQGLASVVEYPEQLLTEVLYWTGGQPFLTQKLCRLIVENSTSILSNGNIAEEFARFVRSQIIEENWESKDQPEHLKTIRDRVIKRSEQRASYLLELYQKVWQGEVTAKSTPEESELQLSGLVVNRQGKLRVYNRIYREVFNDKWIEAELASLRPYAEAFRGWIASGEQDKSRLLRGKALEEAEVWAEGKELSFQDRQFLAASRQQKIQEETEELERQAQLERERKDKEAAEQANKKLTEANQKAQELIRQAKHEAETYQKEAQSAKDNAERLTQQISTVNKLVDLGTELNHKGQREKAQEAWGIAGLSFKISDDYLKQALLLNTMSLIYQDQAQLEEAEPKSEEGLILIEKSSVNNSLEKSQIQIHAYYTRGQLHQLKQEDQKAAQYYKKAVDILNSKGISLLTQGISILAHSNFQQPSRIVFLTLWEAAYLQYMKPLNELKQESVRKSLKSLQYDNLEYLLKSQNQWRDADLQTYRLMVVETQQESWGHLDIKHIENFNCNALRKIDQNWLKYSNGRFGFSVQKKIFLEEGNQLWIYDEEVYRKTLINDKDKLLGSYVGESYKKFLRKVGWKFLEGMQLVGDELSYNLSAREGHLPYFWRAYWSSGARLGILFSRAENCNL